MSYPLFPPPPLGGSLNPLQRLVAVVVGSALWGAVIVVLAQLPRGWDLCMIIAWLLLTGATAVGTILYVEADRKIQKHKGQCPDCGGTGRYRGW